MAKEKRIREVTIEYYDVYFALLEYAEKKFDIKIPPKHEALMYHDGGHFPSTTFRWSDKESNEK